MVPTPKLPTPPADAEIRSGSSAVFDHGYMNTRVWCAAPAAALVLFNTQQQPKLSDRRDSAQLFTSPASTERAEWLSTRTRSVLGAVVVTKRSLPPLRGAVSTFRGAEYEGYFMGCAALTQHCCETRCVPVQEAGGEREKARAEAPAREDHLDFDP